MNSSEHKILINLNQSSPSFFLSASKPVLIKIRYFLDKSFSFGNIIFKKIPERLFDKEAHSKRYQADRQENAEQEPSVPKLTIQSQNERHDDNFANTTQSQRK